MDHSYGLLWSTSTTTGRSLIQLCVDFVSNFNLMHAVSTSHPPPPHNRWKYKEGYAPIHELTNEKKCSCQYSMNQLISALCLYFNMDTANISIHPKHTHWLFVQQILDPKVIKVYSSTIYESIQTWFLDITHINLAFLFTPLTCQHAMSEATWRSDLPADDTNIWSSDWSKLKFISCSANQLIN